MDVQFERTIGVYRGGIEVETITAIVPSTGPEPHRIVFHDSATAAGYDGLQINDTWFEDKTEDDLFCSEMFGELTGKYPYEVREMLEAQRYVMQ